MPTKKEKGGKILCLKGQIVVERQSFMGKAPKCIPPPSHTQQKIPPLPACLTYWSYIKSSISGGNLYIVLSPPHSNLLNILIMY